MRSLMAEIPAIHPPPANMLPIPLTTIHHMILEGIPADTIPLMVASTVAVITSRRFPLRGEVSDLRCI